MDSHNNIQSDFSVDFVLNTLVVQPTTLCNLNCTYCYLPNRSEKFLMSVETANKVAQELEQLNLNHVVNVLWHSGEPLTCSVQIFEELVMQFEGLRKAKRIRHSIQTNGTLIDSKWCELFSKYNFSVGVSIDGWEYLNEYRVDWRGKSAFDKIINGINHLKESNVSFGVICVVTEKSIIYPTELYTFFCQLGCESVGFSIVEEEGVNKNLLFRQPDVIKNFWSDILRNWKINPCINVREFRRITVWLESEMNNKQASSVMKDTLPSIAYNGDVVLVSPEFLGINPKTEYESFIVGNIYDNSLQKIIDDGLNSTYIMDYLKGMEKCKKECEYFGYCRGGDASNKYFELGSLNVTRTNHCDSTKMQLVDAVLEAL